MGAVCNSVGDAATATPPPPPPVSCIGPGPSKEVGTWHRDTTYTPLLFLLALSDGLPPVAVAGGVQTSKKNTQFFSLCETRRDLIG